MRSFSLSKGTMGLLAVVLLLLCACGGVEATATKRPTVTPAPSPTPGERVDVNLIRVSDGDTIVVEIDGLEYRLRYLGMNTPETHHPDIGAEWLGQEATEANRALLEDGALTVEQDLSDTDHYDRLLRYVWVGDTMVQLELLRQGLARVRFYEPDVKYRQQFFAAEQEARQAKRGLWGPTPTPAPKQPFPDGITAWTAAVGEDEVVSVWHDPAVDEPHSLYPEGTEVTLVSGFWVPWDGDGQWWYWVALDQFRGWIAADDLTDVAPATLAGEPPAPYVAYDLTSIAGDERVSLRAAPGLDAEVTGQLGPNTRVQVTAIGWDQAEQQWWYYVETNTAADGWVLPDRLNWEDRTPG